MKKYNKQIWLDKHIRDKHPDYANVEQEEAKVEQEEEKRGNRKYNVLSEYEKQEKSKRKQLMKQKKMELEENKNKNKPKKNENFKPVNKGEKRIVHNYRF